jgi:hypothetical protein
MLGHGAETEVNLAGEGVRCAVGMQFRWCSGRCLPPGIRLLVRLLAVRWYGGHIGSHRPLGSVVHDDAVSSL